MKQLYSNFSVASNSRNPLTPTKTKHCRNLRTKYRRRKVILHFENLRNIRKFTRSFSERGTSGSGGSDVAERPSKDEHKSERSRFSFKENRRASAKDTDEPSDKGRRSADKDRVREVRIPPNCFLFNIEVCSCTVLVFQERLKREQLRLQGRERRERMNVQVGSNKPHQAATEKETSHDEPR